VHLYARLAGKFNLFVFVYFSHTVHVCVYAQSDTINPDSCDTEHRLACLSNECGPCLLRDSELNLYIHVRKCCSL